MCVRKLGRWFDVVVNRRAHSTSTVDELEVNADDQDRAIRASDTGGNLLPHYGQPLYASSRGSVLRDRYTLRGPHVGAVM